MFFHPKILAKKIIEEIDKLEGDLYEMHGRMELCLPKSLINHFPYKSDRKKLTDLIWDILYKTKTYNISRFIFIYKDSKYILTSYKKEWELDIRVFIKTWEGETEITLIPLFCENFDDPELIELLNNKKCKIINFPIKKKVNTKY